VVYIQQYIFHCSWLTDAFMPNYWGSALRGGFGKWLKKVGCILRIAKCNGCVVRPSCAYGFVFETESSDYAKTGRINARPHPVVIEPPVPSPKETRIGDSFTFSMILMDRANDFFPHIFYSILKLGKEDGLGARNRQGYGRFTIESVLCDSEVLFSHDQSELKRPSSLRKLELGANSHEDLDYLQVFYETPFRVKHNGRFCRDIPFHVLVRAALRRISSLEAAYGAGEPNLDYRGLISRAEKVETESSELRWEEIPRFSARQKRKMLIGGPVGRVSYKGDGLSEFVPLLKYCETVHIGKQTFFGLGKIEIELGDVST